MREKLSQSQIDIILYGTTEKILVKPDSVYRDRSEGYYKRYEGTSAILEHWFGSHWHLSL